MSARVVLEKLTLHLLRDGSSIQVAPKRVDGLDAARTHAECREMLVAILECCGPLELRAGDVSIVTVNGGALEGIAFRGREAYQCDYSPFFREPEKVWYSDEQLARASTPPEQPTVRTVDVGDGVEMEVFD